MSQSSNPWDVRFQAREYVYGTEPNVFLSSVAHHFLSGGDTLAIAEGEGRNAVFLAEQGLCVTAWDYASSGLEKTKKLAKNRGVDVHTELVDLNRAKWQPNHWDQIVCIFGHFPTPLRLKTLQAVKDAVKPGGLYVSEVYSVSQLPYKSGGPRDVDLLYQPEEFLQIFKDWKITHFFMGEVIRQEGTLHNGLSHVIQFVGRKPV